MPSQRVTVMASVTTLLNSDLFYVVHSVTGTGGENTKLSYQVLIQNLSTVTSFGGITQLTGDVTAGPGTGSLPTTLASTGVTPGSYTNTDLTVDSKGRITAASNGTGGGAGLTLIEHFTFTSDSQSHTFSGLDGNTDGVYELIVHGLNGGTGTSVYDLQPNAITSNLSYVQGNSNGSAMTPSSASGPWGLGAAVANGYVYNRTTIYARANPNSVAMNRHYVSLSSNFTSTANNVVEFRAGNWNDNSTNITSLKVTGDRSDSFKSGSEMFLYKYEQ